MFRNRREGRTKHIMYERMCRGKEENKMRYVVCTSVGHEMHYQVGNLVE